MIYIYTDKYTPRVQYVFSHVFQTMLQQDIKWVQDWEDLPNPTQEVVVAYTEKSCPKEMFHVYPQGLLFKKGIKPQTIQMGSWNGLKTFFATPQGSIPFDVFAAIFYLITRYEEYIAPADAFDELGCYKAECSLAYQENFLHQPLVDAWVMAMEELLIKKHPNYQKSNVRCFVFRPLIVIDTLFKYQNKSFCNNVYQFVHNVCKGRWAAVHTQIKSLLRITEDPYCNFSSLLQMHNRNNLLPIFFLRVSYKKWFERPIYAFGATYRKLLSQNYFFELHATPEAANSYQKLLSERKKLFKITKSQVTMNCFHQLAFSFPTSYRNLVKASFKGDYSMSYANYAGFRASTCTPYRYYDLEKEDYYKLLIHPVALSDDVLRKKGYKRKDVYNLMLELATEVQQVNGEFVCLFHNDILSDSGRWHHWLSVYESAIRAIANMEVK